MYNTKKKYSRLPSSGLFEFYELYREFLPLFRKHREYFYDWCEIGSIYGAPADCIWVRPCRIWRAGAGRGSGIDAGIWVSSRLTFSNSLLREEHLSDKRCNELCALFEKNVENKETKVKKNGVIVYSDLFAGIFEKELSWAVFCLVNNESVDRFEHSE